MNSSIFQGAVLISLLTSASTKAAPVPAAVDFTELSLDDLASIKVPTVVGASKHEQKITEAPSAVSIVSADEIKQQGHRTLADILRSVRGMYVDYDRGYNAIGVRGVNRPGDYGGRVLITVNGHRLNDAIYDTAASGTDFLLDVDLIERVEVIRGPGSSLYGNNAFFGVINVVTRTGRDSRGTELAVSAGTFDTYTGRATYATTFANGVELLVSGTLQDSAGDRQLNYPEFSAINNGNAENMDRGGARSAFASISWKGLSLEGGYVSREKTWPTAPYSTADAIVIFNDPTFVTTDERAFANLSFQQLLAGEWALTARAYYDRYQFEGLYPYDYLDPQQPVYVNHDFAQYQGVGGEIQLNKTFAAKHRVTAGAELRYDLQIDQRNTDLDPPVTYLDSSESAQIFSLYAQDEFRVNRNFLVNVGLRYDRFSSFGDTLNPRAAVIFQPDPTSTYKLLYGSAFRAPNGYESYYESTINKRNPELGPETIRSLEVVWEQQFGQHWRTTAGLFYNDIKDLIAYREDLSDGLFYFDNVDAVVAKGGEIEVEGQWADGLRGRASYTYSHTQDATIGRELTNSPAHVGKLSVSVPLRRNQLFGSIELQGLSQRTTPKGGHVGSAWLANFTLFSRELVKGLELSATVYNLFDQRYSDPASDDFTQDAIQQDGRNYRLRLTLRF